MASDPQRHRWREVVRNALRAVVLAPEQDPLERLRESLDETLVVSVDDGERAEVEAMVNEELRQLHEGVLVR